MNEIILEAKNICKAFPGVVANDGINLQLRKGEVLALLGENGAGKSTLMNILYGFYQPDAGEILIRGKPVTLATPRDAINCGIGMVHQHFMLIPVFTVLENIVLGMDLNKGLMLRGDDYRTMVEKIAHTYGMEVDVNKKVSELSIGGQQRVEILKTLFRQADILILDEPTSVLTPQEAEDLFSALLRFKRAGKSIMFISHKMDELMNFSDRIVVLRNGKNVGEFTTGSTTVAELARTMVGHDVKTVKNLSPQVQTKPQVEIENLCLVDERGVQVLKNISFTIGEGEIVGLAGIDGNGQAELAETLMGLRKESAGDIRFRGESLLEMDTRQRQDKGLGHIPADRKRQGLILEYSVENNLVLEDIEKPSFSKFGRILSKNVSAHAQKLICEYDVRPPLRETKALNLSGGNQQKVVVAREFDRMPRFLVASHPIRGIDINATEFIHNKLLEKRAEGASILLISSDLDEIFDLADRIAVICQGQLVGIVRPSEVSAGDVGLLMTGCKLEEVQ